MRNLIESLKAVIRRKDILVNTIVAGILVAISGSATLFYYVRNANSLENPPKLANSPFNQLAGLQSGEITGSVLSLETVAEHNAEQDCWTVIDENVYDISQYVNFHPGGKQLILKACGVDSSTLFHTKDGRGKDHLQSTYALLDTFKLGALGQETTTQQNVQNTNNQNDIGSTPNGLGNTRTTTDTSGTTSTLTTEIVAQHKSSGDCWIIVNGNAYNVTQYIPFHPGGQQRIINYCGKDATTAFQNKGGEGSHSSYAWNTLGGYYIGTIGETAATTANNNAISNTKSNTVNTSNTNTGTSTGTGGSSNSGSNVQLTTSTVSQHNSPSDCWLIISNKVYNVTQYIPYHPGGQQRIISYCGNDATTAFDTKGGKGSHSSGAKNTLGNYYIGDLNSSTTTTQIDNTVNSAPMPSGGEYEDEDEDEYENEGSSNAGSSNVTKYEEAILSKYPGANITKLSIEDDGKAEAKFYWNGQKYEAKLNSSYEITSAKAD